MFEHVLVPLDYSALSEKALPYALHIVPPDGKLTLLIAVEDHRSSHVYPMETAASYIQAAPETTPEDLREQASKYLTRITGSLRKPLPAIDHVIQFGLPADAIVDYADNQDVKAIVMCTHGRTGFSRWLLGSVTQKVLNGATCPVIVIPGRKLSK